MRATSSTNGNRSERFRRRIDRQPLLILAAFGLCAVVGADGQPLAGGTGWLAVAALCLWARRGGWIASGMLLSLVLGVPHFREVERRASLRQALGTGATGEHVLTLVEEPVAMGRGWAGIAETADGRDRVRLRGEEAVPAKGATVRAIGWLTPPEAPRNPGEFDRRAWLDRQGVYAEMRAWRVECLRGPPAWTRWGGGVRQGFRDAVTAGLGPASDEAAVIRAVVLGERPDDDSLIEPFRFTGTLHVFAVSGLHVGMVGLLAWLALRGLGVSRRSALLPLILVMLGYAWLTGLNPPAVRAACMAAIVLGAFWFRRRPRVVNALGLAALFLMWRDADLVFTAGAQLSFLVVAVIGLGHQPLARLWQWLAREEPYLPRSLYGPVRERWLGIRRRTADALTVATTAWMGSAPLTAWYFGIVTPISIVASVVLSLLVLPMLAIGLISGVLAPVPSLPPLLNRVNAKVARGLIGLAEFGARVPGGYFELARDRPAEEFLIVFDLHSDGAACWHAPGETLMIDGGSQRALDYVLMPALRRLALRPSSVAVTHPDGGHVGGLAELLDAFPVRRGLVPVHRALSTNYRDFLATAAAHDVPLVLGATGRRYPLTDGAWLEVLHQPEPWSWQTLADQRIMPVRLHWRGWRILFVADAGWRTERTMLRAGVDLASDVIVAGRHQHDLSLGSAFVEATGARAIIASHDDFPANEAVPQAWREACEARGLAVLHQGESGAVTVTLPGPDRLRLEGFVDGRVVEFER